MDVVDKDSTFFRQLVHHKAVMDDLFADVDRGAKGLQRNPDDIDGPHHARAEPAGFQQKYAFFLSFGRRALGSDRCLRDDGAHVLYYTVNTPVAPPSDNFRLT